MSEGAGGRQRHETRRSTPSLAITRSRGIYQAINIAFVLALFAGLWYIDARDPTHPLAAAILGVLFLLAACVFHMTTFGGFKSISNVAFFTLADTAGGSRLLVLGYGVLAFALFKWLVVILKRDRDG